MWHVSTSVAAVRGLDRETVWQGCRITRRSSLFTFGGSLAGNGVMETSYETFVSFGTGCRCATGIGKTLSDFLRKKKNVAWEA